MTYRAHDMMRRAPRHIAVIALPEPPDAREFAAKPSFPRAPVDELVGAALEYAVPVVSLFPAGHDSRTRGGLRQFVDSVRESCDTPRWSGAVALEIRGETMRREPGLKAREDGPEKPRLTVVCHTSYSGRHDLLRVAREIAGEVASGDLEAGDVGAGLVADRISEGRADPDLLICTGGGRRIQDAMVWQIAYTEIHLMDKPWQEFNRDDFALALSDYAHRDRRFGKIKSQ